MWTILSNSKYYALKIPLLLDSFNNGGFCLNSNDYDLSLKLCKYFANHPDLDVRANVVHGLGYIGMNFKKIDKSFAKSLLRKASKENNRTMIGAVTDAQDDLQHYVKGF